MKNIVIIMLMLLVYGCKPKDKHPTGVINQPVKTKIINIQNCLDSILNRRHDDDYENYKLIVIKNTPFSVGLDSLDLSGYGGLHLGKNKIHFEDLPNGFLPNRHEVNKDNRIYINIKYGLKSESNLDIIIHFYYFNTTYIFKLIRQNDNWIIKDIDSEIS